MSPRSSARARSSHSAIALIVGWIALFMFSSLEVQAQLVFREMLGESAGDGFGTSVACVDRNTELLLVVGSPAKTIGPSSNSGAVTYFRPADGPNPVATLVPSFSAMGGEKFGQAIASVPDIDGDGIAEIGVGAPGVLGLGQVFVYLDPTLNPAYSRYGSQASELFGAALAGLPDISADGRGDLAIGAPGRNSSAGAVVLLSPIDSVTLGTVDGVSSEELGSSLAVISDINGDSVQELLAGAPGGANGGALYLISLASSTALSVIQSPVAGLRFGQSVANVGDVNGDMVDDFIVGAPENPDGPGTGFGLAVLYSGAGAHLSPSVICTINSSGFPDSVDFGSDVVGLGDMNGDGFRDFAVSSPQANAGFGEVRVFYFNGASCLQTFVVTGSNSGEELGKALGGHKLPGPLCDYNGDNLPDLIVGTSNDQGGADRGSALIILGETPTPTPSPTPTATPTPTPTPTSTATPDLPQEVRLSFRISERGEFTGSVGLDRPPPGPCELDLFARSTVGEQRGPIRRLASGVIATLDQPLYARDVPRALLVAGTRPVLNAIARVRCPGGQALFSNVAARYMSCGTGDGLSLPEWFENMRERVLFQERASARRSSKKRSIRPRRSSGR